jgi:hypothetical protein
MIDECYDISDFFGLSNELGDLSPLYWLTDNELLRLALRQPFGVPQFSWRVMQGVADSAGLEGGLIAWLRPPCNRVMPRTQ